MADKLLRSHSLEKSKGADGITTSGSFSFWEDSPVSPLNIGDEFQPVPGGPTLKVGKISISDSVVGERFGRPFRQWQITVEGDSNVQSEDDTGDSNVKYTFLIEKGDDGITKRTGTMEVTNTGASPSITVQVGENFTVPGVGYVTCTKVSGGDTYTDSGAHRWTVTYEGARVEAGGGGEDNPTLPESKEEISYEINGTTTRSVSGEFIVLRRSTTPITKKSLTVYNNSSTRLTTPGETYASSGCIAVSETVAKEEQKVNGVTIGSYYRHELTLEA